MPHWYKISRLFSVPDPNYWARSKTTSQKNVVFLSNPYNIELRLWLNFSHRNASFNILVIWPHLQCNLSHVKKNCWWRHRKKLDVVNFISKYLYFKKTRVTIFADIIQIVTIFIKTIFKNSKNFKRIRKKLCTKMEPVFVFLDFRWKHADC